MDHQRIDRRGDEARPVSEILADARAMQARHAPGVLGAAAFWLRSRVVPAADGSSASAARRLVIH